MLTGIGKLYTDICHLSLIAAEKITSPIVSLTDGWMDKQSKL